MIVAFWAAVGKIALKVLQFLVGDEKGRKFLGYVIGIVVFIVLLPLIATIALFGSMSSGSLTDIVGYDAIYENLPTDVREQIEEYDVQLQMIESVFAENGLSDVEVNQAKLIFLSYLTVNDHDELFYQQLADCFLEVNEDSDLLTNVSSAFGIEISDADRNQFEDFFGGE